MAIQVSATSEQTLQVNVTGPGDVTSTFVTTGIADVNVHAFAGGDPSQLATFALHVGPQLTAAQFRKAIASAALAGLTMAGDAVARQWSVTGVDADFDGETGKVELQFDVRVTIAGDEASGATTAVAGVGFQVLILAAV